MVSRMPTRKPQRTKVLMENLEQRALFSATGTTDAEAVINDLLTTTVKGAVGTIPVVGGAAEAALGWALGMANEDPSVAQFQQVNDKLDKLSDDVGHLATRVNELSSKLDVSTRDALITSIPLAEVRTALNLFENYLNASTKSERLAVKSDFMDKAKHLDLAIEKFEDAFQGTGGRTNLMEAFSAVLKNSAETAPFLTNANYTTKLQQVYQYYKDWETIALNLRVEYLHAHGQPDTARSAVHHARDYLKLDATTMPKPIPHYAVYDTRSGLMWATFQTSSMSHYIAKHNFASLVSGDKTYLNYLYNNTTAGQTAAKYGLAAYDAQTAENARLGIKSFFKWSLPSAETLQAIKSPDQSSDAAIKAYLPSKGFNAGVTNYQVWLDEDYWKQVAANSKYEIETHYYPKPTTPMPWGQVTTVTAATMAGRNGIAGKDAYRWYHGTTASNMASGVQPLYKSDAGLDYVSAKKVSSI